jgi:insulysin
MSILENILNQFMFKYLRTEREMGYIAFSKYVSHFCVDGFIIGVEGSKEHPAVVN